MKRIFFNGVIRTMSKKQTVDAVLVEDAIISSTGNYQDLIQQAPDAVKSDWSNSLFLCCSCLDVY